MQIVPTSQRHVRGLSFFNRLCRPAIILLYFAMTCNEIQAASKIEGLKFSAAEVSLLKRLNQIEVGAGISSSMLKLTPFVQLITSTTPTELAITVTTNDWDQIFGALKGLDKIKNCKIVEEIDLWKDADGNDYSSSKSETFFNEVRSLANSRC